MFFTKYLTTGKLPARISQFDKGIYFFKYIFNSFKKYKIVYKTFKKNLKKTSWLFCVFNFQPLFISYCTARNSKDISSSANFLELYIKTYLSSFIIRKTLFSFLRIFFLVTTIMITMFFTVETLPNFLRLPDYIAIYQIIGSIMGFAIYKILFSDHLIQFEIISMLNFLCEKNLPGRFEESSI